MEPTTLASLRRRAKIVELQDGLRVQVEPRWTIDDEQQLSWITILRLVECCREYHLERDFQLAGETPETTVRACDVQFRAPIAAEGVIEVNYRVSEVGETSYRLSFRLGAGVATTAMVDLVVVFVGEDRQAVAPGPSIRERLLSLARNPT